MATVQISVQAIRLTNEVIAEKGDYLMIYPDDRIVVLSPDEAARLGIRAAARHATPATVPLPRKRTRDATRGEWQRTFKSIIPPEHRTVTFNVNGKQVSMARMSVAAAGRYRNNEGQCQTPACHRSVAEHGIRRRRHDRLDRHWPLDLQF